MKKEAQKKWKVRIEKGRTIYELIKEEDKDGPVRKK